MTVSGIVHFVTEPRRDGGPRANNSVRTRISVVRVFHDYCHRDGIPVPDCSTPLLRLRRSYPRLLGKQQGRYAPARLNRDQLAQLYRTCQDGTWIGSRDQLVIRFLALGLRRAEVAALTWADLKADGTVSRIGKMHRVRTVFPGPTLSEMLGRWRAFYEHHVGPAEGDAALFVTWKAAPGTKVGSLHLPEPGISYGMLGKVVADRAAQAGLGHVAPHDLRRSLARIMYEERTPEGARRCDLSDIQAALGHHETSGAVTQACYIGPLDTEGAVAAGGLVD